MNQLDSWSVQRMDERSPAPYKAIISKVYDGGGGGGGGDDDLLPTIK